MVWNRKWLVEQEDREVQSEGQGACDRAVECQCSERAAR